MDEREFEKFMSLSPVAPGRGVSEGILKSVRRELEPRFSAVIKKLAVIQLALGGAFLLFCPQLGIGPFIGHFGLMNFFMCYGRYGCAGLCGSVFLFVSLFLAVLCLTREELRVIGRQRVINAAILATISFVSLMLLGGSHMGLSVIAWPLGATVGGWIGLQLGILMRFRRFDIAF